MRKKITIGIVMLLIMTLSIPVAVTAQEVNGNESRNIEITEQQEGKETTSDEKSKQVAQYANIESVYPSYTIASSKQTLRPNPEDEVSIHVKDLDFKLEGGQTVKFFDLEIWTEYYFDSRELQSIELPYITAKDEMGVDLNVDIYFMTLTGGSLWVADPVRITEENRGHTVYRSEIEAFINEHQWLPHYEDGSWPVRMYMLIETTPKDLTIPVEETTWENVPSTEMTFHGDVVYNYKVNGNVPYFDSYYDVFTLLSDFDTNPGNVERSFEKDHYLYYETSEIVASSDKSDNLVPGEEVELTFTIRNFSDIDNVLSAIIDVEGLELVPGSSDDIFDLTLWKKTETGYQIPLALENGDWYTLAGNSSISFKQKFKIRDDFNGKEIDIIPALSAVDLIHEKENDEKVKLKLKSEEPLNKYTVTYTDGVEGEEVFVDQVYSNLVENSSTPGFQGTPTREGYTFKGWNPVLEPTVTRDAVYTAEWEINKYTVTYESSGGTLVQPETVNYNKVFTQPTNPVKDGNIFKGWYSDEALTQAYDFSTPASKDITLYAKWEEEIIPVKEFTITYTDGVNGTVFADESIVAKEGEATPAYSKEISRYGYTFEGWSPEVAATVTEDVTYVAQWKAIEESIKPVEPTNPVKPVEPALPSTGVSNNHIGLLISLLGSLLVGLRLIVDKKKKLYK